MDTDIITVNRFDFINKLSVALEKNGLALGKSNFLRAKDVDPAYYSILELVGKKKTTITKNIFGFTREKTVVQRAQAFCKVLTTFAGAESDMIKEIKFQVYGSDSLEIVRQIVDIYLSLFTVYVPKMKIVVVSNSNSYEYIYDID